MKRIRRGNTDRSHDELRDVIDDLQVDHRSTSVLPVVHILHEQTTSDVAGDQSKKEADPSPDVKTDEEPCLEDDQIEKEPYVSTYRHESGELYAEDRSAHGGIA